MKRYIIKNEDGTTQTVMPAIHNTRKEALLTILHYATEVVKRDKDDSRIEIPVDYMVDEIDEVDTNDRIPNFKAAKQLIGSSRFILAEDSFCFSGIEFNIIHTRALVALNELFTIAQAWNMLDNFVPNFSNYEQFKWFPCFEYNEDTKKFVFDKARYALSYTNAPTQLRLCFRTEKRAEQFGRQFVNLYNQVFLL